MLSTFDVLIRERQRAPMTATSTPSDANRFVVISGCSGAGKSTLLAELARRGYATIDEPGRRIVKDELQRGGSALPWIDLAAFLQRAFDIALADCDDAARFGGWVFFDRSLIDAVAGIVGFQHRHDADRFLLARVTGEPVHTHLGPLHRYHRRVFLAPPWPEIHVLDQERRHSLEAAVAEYEHLLTVYPALGYDVAILPKVDVGSRADFVLDSLRVT
jgi:predicted ATPase